MPDLSFVNVQSGDYVAVMPGESSPAVDVLEITRVFSANSVYVKLTDGRMYTTLGGRLLGAKPVTYIVPTTDEHRTALDAKQPKSA